MFFILATAAFFAAIVLLLVYTTQISRTKRNYLGRNAVKKITEQAVEMAFYRGLAACFKLLTGEELEYYQQIWNYGKEK